jgi:hypothetical protein
MNLTRAAVRLVFPPMGVKATWASTENLPFLVQHRPSARRHRALSALTSPRRGTVIERSVNPFLSWALPVQQPTAGLLRSGRWREGTWR